MGLFDGQPSAADLARRFGLHVLAVVDASAMAGTFGALAFGLQHFQPGLPWAGVLANRVASERHGAMLRDGLREPADWLGGLPRSAAMGLPERHLGLVAASEVGDALQRLDAAADALAQTPLGQMTPADLQRWNVSFAAPAQPPGAPEPVLQGKTVAIARDAAFCFIYQANLDCLRTLGARLDFFSPLADAALPPCDAVWLPGGYPELHAAQLSANTALRASLQQHVAAGKPLYAECGGMMALFDTLQTKDGSSYAMWGLLPGTVTMQQRLAALGPQQLVLDAGTLRGHTFHYSTCSTPLEPAAHTTRPGASHDSPGEAVYRLGPITASYFHAWFASSPAAVSCLFQSPVCSTA